MWLVFALLSAVFAALTSIFAKVGIEKVDSTLATAIRTVVVVGMSWLMVFVTNTQSGISNISKKKLDIPYIVRLGNRCVVAVLLQGNSAWRRVKGCTCGQVECSYNPCACLCLSARGVYRKIRGRMHTYRGRHLAYGFVA